MKKTLLFIASFLGCSTFLNAQWDSLAYFNQVIDDIETYNTDLFIAGDFTKMNGSNCYWSASYNGSSFSSQSNLIGGSGIRDMEVFNSDLYCVDALNHGGVTGVGMWTGFSWTDGGGTNYSHSLIYADGNDLYVGSDDGKIRKKTGTGSFSSFYDFAGSGGMSSMVRYNGKLVCSGSFTAIGGVPANNIAQWDGANWTALGTGLSSGAGSMVVYNNELYVAGKMATAGGVTVNNIAKWNGSTWSSLAGGTGSCPNGVRDMKATSFGVVVVGDFTQVGTVSTKNVAFWNGSQWIGMGVNHSDNFVNCVEEFNGKIYVGTFSFSRSHLFRFNGTLGVAGVDELGINEKLLSLYPNPANEMITLNVDDFTGEATLSIENMIGEKVITKTMTTSREQIDISALSNGVYFVALQKGEKKVVKKFVKQ